MGSRLHSQRNRIAPGKSASMELTPLNRSGFSGTNPEELLPDCRDRPGSPSTRNLTQLKLPRLRFWKAVQWPFLVVPGSVNRPVFYMSKCRSMAVATASGASR